MVVSAKPYSAVEAATNNAYTLLPAVAGNWPASLQTWVSQILLGQRQSPPDLSIETWRGWLESLEEHGLSSLLFSHLRTCDSGIRPPAEIFSALRTTYFAGVARIMVRRTQLDNILKRFAAKEIASLVLKGAALGEMVYDDVFQRPSADIDILVSKEDYEKARGVLLDSGYRSKRGDRSRQMGWSCDEEFMPAADDEERQYVVELHWALTSDVQLLSKIETDGLFGRAEGIPGLNQAIQVLHPVDALVYACLHLVYKHINELRLIWLYDIHLLAAQIERHGLWQETVALSQQWQARLALKTSLELSRHWFRTPYPAIVSDLDYEPADLDEMEMFNLVAFQLEHGQRERWLKKHLFQIKRLKGRDRYRYLKSHLFPSRQEIEANYPGLREWPGPLVHLGRLAMMFVTKK